MPLIQNEHWRDSAIIRRRKRGYIFRKENQEVKFVDNDATQVFVSKEQKELFVRKKPVIRNCLQKQMQFYSNSSLWNQLNL